MTTLTLAPGSAANASADPSSLLLAGVGPRLLGALGVALVLVAGYLLVVG